MAPLQPAFNARSTGMMHEINARGKSGRGRGIGAIRREPAQQPGYSSCSNPSTAIPSSISSPSHSGIVVSGPISRPDLRFPLISSETFPRKRFLNRKHSHYQRHQVLSPPAPACFEPEHRRPVSGHLPSSGEPEVRTLVRVWTAICPTLPDVSETSRYRREILTLRCSDRPSALPKPSSPPF